MGEIRDQLLEEYDDKVYGPAPIEKIQVCDGVTWCNVQQNTDEWLDMRIAKVTGSAMPKIMANFGKAFGEPAKKLAVTLAVESVTGKRSLNDEYSNPHMERGHEQEPVALQLYSDQEFVDVLPGGFFDAGRVGCSPDGLVDDTGMAEVKSVVSHIHLANIKRADVDPAYKWQVWFNVLTAKREWIDFISYCADFPDVTKLFVHRVYAEDLKEVAKDMKSRLNQFFELIEQNKRIIRGEQ